MAQYVHFQINNEDFAMKISDVQEILPYRDIVPISGAHSDLDGVIHLRGSVIPVLNLQRRLMIEKLDICKDTRIVLIRTSAGFLGIRVNEVRRIITLEPNQISDMPSLLKRFKVYHLDAIARYEDRLIKLISPETFFQNYDFDEVVGDAGTLTLEDFERLQSESENPVITDGESQTADEIETEAAFQENTGAADDPSEASKAFICPQCGKRFGSQSWLTRHLKATHGKQE
jgi:purine-binding chemotaxis protein CheW